MADDPSGVRHQDAQAGGTPLANEGAGPFGLQGSGFKANFKHGLSISCAHRMI